MFERLIKLIREEKVSLFIGAGFSLKAGSPSVQKLKNCILNDFENDIQRKQHQHDDLQTLSDYYVEEVCQGSRQKLIYELKSLFQFIPQDMTDHQMLSQIPHFRHIFTTNYDTLLEDSYEKNDIQVVRKDQDLTELDESKHVTIYKIHGDFQDADSVIITKTDYNDFHKKSKRRNDLIWKVVESEFAQKNILFIGYSLEDDNILEIIRTVTNKLKKNHKQMFLLAPRIRSGREKELKKMHVTYLNSCATPFLEELTKEILANSSDDFKNKKITADTYSRICNMHGFTPKVSISTKDKNTIEDIKALPGFELHQKLNFTLDKDFAKAISRFDFEKDGQIDKEDPFPELPHIKIDKKFLISSEYSINNIVLEKDFKTLFIYPSEKETSLTINIPSRNFFEMVEGKAYRLNDNKFVITFDCHIYKTKIVIERPQKKSQILTFKFSFKFNESYSDNNQALLWINFIDAVFQEEEFKICEITSQTFNSENNKFNIKSNKFKEYKEYYQNIKTIELCSCKKFRKYNGYTEKLAYKAKLLMSYYKHIPLKITPSNDILFTIKAENTNDLAKEAIVGKHLSIAIPDDNNIEYSINNETFIIPYTYRFLHDCEVKEIKKLENNYTILTLFCSNHHYMILATKEAINKEIPALKFQLKSAELEYLANK